MSVESGTMVSTSQPPPQNVDEAFSPDFFLGITNIDEVPDVIIAPVPYELTTSYGQGTINGPAACIAASYQVELYDEILDEELPAGSIIRTEMPWDGKGNTLKEQLEGIENYANSIYKSQAFPIFLGGEHGILPPIIRAIGRPVTVIQIDAHADLRSSLDGENYSHACAALRALDEGAISLYQVGIRAYCKEELERIKSDKRIHTWFAKDVMDPCNGKKSWNQWLMAISSIDSPIHLTIDLDGLDGILVPATGTPVPGGLSFWHVIQTIETVFNNCNVISADINEIVPQKDTPLTEFTAAMLAKKIAACQIHKKKTSVLNTQKN